ncbi:MAG: hypothetical protein ACYCQI_16420, partial [Gammaproteobacteria bacterium]
RGTHFEIYRSGRYETVDFYPIRGRGTSGFNFMIYGGGGAGFMGAVGGFCGRDFESYVNQKQQAYKSYATTPRRST